MLFENIFLPLALLAAAALGTPVATSTDLSGPTPPQLKWLYTAYALCPADLLNGALTPAGIRKEIPIVGGNFTGPGINGKFRSQGADWGTVSSFSLLFMLGRVYHERTPTGRPNEAEDAASLLDPPQ